MKKLFKTSFLLSLIFCLSTLNTGAQTATLKWGQIYKDNNLDYYNKYSNYFGHNSDGYYRTTFVKVGGFFGSKEELVQKFNNKHEITASHVILYTNGSEKLKPVNSQANVFVNGKLNYIAYKYNSASKTAKLYKRTLSDDLSEISEWEEFDNLVDVDESDIKEIKLVQSDDRTKFSYYLKNASSIKLKNESITCSIYDKNFGKLESKRIELKDKDKYYMLNSTLTNEGQFVFMIYNDLKFSEKVKDDAKYKYILYLFDSKTNTLSDFDINLKKHYISKAEYFIDNEKKKIIVAAFYKSDKVTNFITFESMGSYVGYIYKQIDINTKKLEKDLVKKFDANVIYLHPENLKSGEEPSLLSNEKIMSLGKWENGNIYMLCEGSSYSSESRTYGDKTSYYDHSSFYQICIMTFDQDGNMIKSSLVQKQQIDKGDQLTSYLSGKVNNKLIFVFYDSEKNYGKKGYIGEAMPAYGDAIVGVVTCDSDGNITNRKVIYRMNKSDKKSPYMDVKNAIKINDNKYFIPCIIKNNYQYGFLTFE
jgi:hypothetical protein